MDSAPRTASHAARATCGIAKNPPLVASSIAPLSVASNASQSMPSSGSTRSSKCAMRRAVPVRAYHVAY
eukprot:4446913-Prymnesium_polylepis.1